MAGPFQNILTATDLGPDAERAVDLSIALAALNGARVLVLHVFEVPAHMYTGSAYTHIGHLVDELQADARRRFEELAASLRARYPRLEAVFKVGNPWEQILASVTELEADLAVLGTRGRRGIARAVLGSVAEKVVRLSPVPVLTVRRPEDP